MGQQEKMVSWSSDYNLGLEEIDGQHRYLIDLINELWHGIVHRAHLDDLMFVMTELERYTVNHFTAEEVFMRAVDYPDFEAHRKSHRYFTVFIAEHKQKISRGESVSLEVLHYLKDWLVNHILKDDKSYASFYEAKKAPRSIFERLFGRFGV